MKTLILVTRVNNKIIFREEIFATSCWSPLTMHGIRTLDLQSKRLFLANSDKKGHYGITYLEK